MAKSTKLSIEQSKEEQLENTIQMRYGVINLLNEDLDAVVKDKDLRRDYIKALKDNTSDLLTQKRINNDDDNAKHDLNLKSSYMALLHRHGGKLPAGDIPGEIETPELPGIDDFEFEISESELKIGNDIDVD